MRSGDGGRSLPSRTVLLSERRRRRGRWVLALLESNLDWEDLGREEEEEEEEEGGGIWRKRKRAMTATTTFRTA